MATLAELAGLINEPTLKDRCKAACLVAASAIIAENEATANHANRLKWAKRVMLDPAGQGELMLRAVLGANASFTVAQIMGVSDANLQTAVNNAIIAVADGT